MWSCARCRVLKPMSWYLRDWPSAATSLWRRAEFHAADPSVTGATFGGLFGYEHVDLPFDEDAFTVDADRAAEAIRKVKPRLVVVGSGCILFPYPVRALKAAAESVGAVLFYDGAHAVGLAAGGGYQDASLEGADVTTGSVPKTLCGPTGGLILSNSPEIAAAIEKITNSLVSAIPTIILPRWPLLWRKCFNLENSMLIVCFAMLERWLRRWMMRD